MGNNSEYVNQLKKLILQIQSGIGHLDAKTKEQVIQAARWKCPDKKEKQLLNDLINRAIEYIDLESVVKKQKCTKDETEKYFSYSRWFRSINMLLGTFDVPLSEVSFSDLSLKE
jgi:hypothetical protein